LRDLTFAGVFGDPRGSWRRNSRAKSVLSPCDGTGEEGGKGETEARARRAASFAVEGEIDNLSRKYRRYRRAPGTPALITAPGVATRAGRIYAGADEHEFHERALPRPNYLADFSSSSRLVVEIAFAFDRRGLFKSASLVVSSRLDRHW